MQSFSTFVESSKLTEDVPLAATSSAAPSDSLTILNPKVQAEINFALTSELIHCVSPESGFQKIRKILIMHNCSLPAVIDLNPEEGEEVFEMHPFGEESIPERYLYVHYCLNEKGFYEFEAEVTDKDGVHDLITDEDNEKD
jgi:hypothetical protein